MSWTLVPIRYGSLQSVPPVPQVMPNGFDVTAPAPVVAMVSVNSWRKVALTLVSAWVIATEHTLVLPALAHAPPQLSKVQPASGVAVSVTGVVENEPVWLGHAPLQLMPAGAEVTAPVPVLVTAMLPVPTPVAFTAWVPPLALSRIWIVAGCAPIAAGLKRTAMSQVLLAPSGLPLQPSRGSA